MISPNCDTERPQTTLQFLTPGESTELFWCLFAVPRLEANKQVVNMQVEDTGSAALSHLF